MVLEKRCGSCKWRQDLAGSWRCRPLGSGRSMRKTDYVLPHWKAKLDCPWVSDREA